MTDQTNNTEQTPQPLDEDLGLAGNIARTFIHSPLSPLIFIGMLALGILGLMVTPRQEDPQISVPLIDIFVQFPGANSRQVANLAIEPLERMMSEIPGVKHVYSASEHEQGIVTVRFEVGQEVGGSIVKIHDKLNSNMDVMPPGVSHPLVKPKGIDDVPVVTLTLWSEVVDYITLRKLGTELLQDIKQVPNTGQGFVVGGQSDQVRIEVKPDKLSSLGVTLDQIAQTIRAANREQGTGYTESDGRHFTVYAGSFLQSTTDVANLLISTANGNPVYVHDVAEVSRGGEELTNFVSYYTGPAYPQENVHANGMPAITIAISKKIGSNGVSVANEILEKIEARKGQLIPDNVNVEVTRNYGVSADEKVNNLILKLFIATGAVTLLVWFALGLKPSIVVTLVIPVVILLTVFAAYLLGMTVDRVSLFALIFSIGILVDDAIVVVENIYRRWLIDGKMSTSTAIDAVREVGNPTLLATFTVVAALLPMGAVRGLMGPYMAPIPVLGSVAMMISLFAAFAFVPYFAMRIRPSMEQLKKSEEREHKVDNWLDGVFRKVLGPLLDDKKKGRLFFFGLIGVFVLVCMLLVTTIVPVKMLPYDNKPEFSVVLDMPTGTTVMETTNATRMIAEKLREIPEVTALQTYSGTAKPFDFNGMVRHYYLRSKPWQGEIQVQLVHKNDRSRSSHEIAVAARDLLKPLKHQLRATMTVVEMPPGPPVLQTVVAEVYAPTDLERRQVAVDLEAIFRAEEGMTDIDNYMEEPYDTVRFKIDSDKAVRRGVDTSTIVRNLSLAFGTQKLGDVKQGSALEPTYIVMQIPLSNRTNVEQLSDLPIRNQAGKTVPLGELGRFVTLPQEPLIFHKDLRPVEYVVGDATGRLQAPIYPMLSVGELLEDYTTPDGKPVEVSYVGPPKALDGPGFEWTGEWTVTYETFRDMGIAFGAALIMIYMLVVWQFGNFVIPAIIMAPIPLTLLGIIPGHLIIGAEFTATSMIGFIALAGIIVRNSILLVDFAIQEIQNGIDVREAVMLSCKARTRPIIITALALVGGASVILTDPIFQGMAASLMFGVLVSTLLTLLVIPLGCISASKYMLDAALPKSHDAE